MSWSRVGLSREEQPGGGPFVIEYSRMDDDDPWSQDVSEHWRVIDRRTNREVLDLHGGSHHSANRDETFGAQSARFADARTVVELDKDGKRTEHALPAIAATDPDEELLRKAVFAAPHDDAPRLAYARWLIERGDPRGDFIARQLAGDDAQDLIARHEQAFLERDGVFAERRVWRRGFVDEIETQAPFWLEKIAWAVAQPAFACVSSFTCDASYSPGGDEAAELLAASPHAHGLRAITIDPLNERGLNALARVPALRALALQARRRT